MRTGILSIPISLFLFLGSAGYISQAVTRRIRRDSAKKVTEVKRKQQVAQPDLSSNERNIQKGIKSSNVTKMQKGPESGMNSRFRRMILKSKESSAPSNVSLPSVGVRIWIEENTSTPICSHPSLVVWPCNDVFLDDVVPNIAKLWTLSSECQNSNSRWTFEGMADVFMTNMWNTISPRADRFVDLMGHVLPEACTRQRGNWLELIFSLLESSNSSAISKGYNKNIAHTLYQVVRGYTSEAFRQQQDQITSGTIYHRFMKPLTASLDYRLRAAKTSCFGVPKTNKHQSEVKNLENFREGHVSATEISLRSTTAH